MDAARNPFRASRIESLPFLWPEHECWKTLEERWIRHGRQGALVGMHGNGKSTLLTEWMARLEAEGWDCQVLRLTEEAPRLPRGFCLQPGDRPRCAVLDGAEQLGPLGWRLWKHRTRRADGRILTSHKPGLLPTLLRVETDAARLAQLLRQLLEDDVSRLPAPPEQLLREHSGDVREVFRHLYDVFSAFPNPKIG